DRSDDADRGHRLLCAPAAARQCHQRQAEEKNRGPPAAHGRRAYGRRQNRRVMPALDLLRDRLRELERVVVAFSGGADSAFLAWVANDTLGRERTRAVTAVSPSLAGGERDDCAALAREWGLRRHASPRESPTERPSPLPCSTRSDGPRPRSAVWASASSGCGTTATWRGSSSPPMISRPLSRVASSCCVR